MPTKLPPGLLKHHYEKWAEEYLRSLPLEHFMEATPQATQRKITLESLDLVSARRHDVHVFNELLVQYPLPRRERKRPGQVVPDNMVVLYEGAITAEGSYDIPLQPARPFWMLEYVSTNSKRKDYVDNMKKYEQQLQVPYYLLFLAEAQELTLYHYHDKRYVSVKPNDAGRYAIPELELELGLIDGWVRYWFRGELLPLPAELQRDLDEIRQQLMMAQRQAEIALRQADEERQRAETAQRQADEERQRADREQQSRLALEEELAQLRQERDQLRRLRDQGK